MSRTRLSAAVLALCAWQTASAHDFWLQPDNYRPQPDATVGITVQVGHGPDRQRTAMRVRRVTHFAAIAPDGSSTDLRAGLHFDGGDNDNSFQPHTPGTYVLVMATDNNAQSRLPAAKFNDYLKAEGLTMALQARMRAHRTTAEGSEIYSRHTKALVQVGLQDGRTAPPSSNATTPLGLALEIVPELDPCTDTKAQDLPVRVRFEGKPLSGALVKLTNLAHDETPDAVVLTDAAGRALFAMPASGDWMFNVIWTKLQAAGREADFETYFSSLSFGRP